MTRRVRVCWIVVMSALFCGSIAISAQPADAQQPAAVTLHWLDAAAPAVATGVSWGVPFPKGAVKKEQAFSLKDATGKGLPLQSWPLAYWPDGSIKWNGFAAVAGQDSGASLTLAPDSATSPAATTAQPIERIAREREMTIDINAGRLKARIVKWGGGIIDSISIDGREVVQDGRLVCIVQDGPENSPTDAPARQEFRDSVRKATIEQNGPVRAVIKLEGVHKALKGNREWLPFIVRLYFYAGCENVRMVHTIIYDGDEQKDFIRGLGIRFAVPMREEVQNRHVRLSGEGAGIWAEPVQPLRGRQGRFVSAASGGADVFPDQIEGKRVPNRAEVDDKSQALMNDFPIWDAFKITQLNADGFNIFKRTNVQSVWLPVTAGNRSTGLAFIGDVSGGLGVNLKNFWQSYPAAIEVQNATTSSAELTTWLWSPDAPAMDLRHYDTRAHGLEAEYEDVQPGFSTPVGVARTSELMLYPSASVPNRAVISQEAQLGAKPPVFVCSPKYLHEQRAFGIWSLPDPSTPLKRAVEEQLDANLAYYQKSVDQHNWYGFWDFGDIMHSYDSVRHEWRYDLGGMAWDNSELGSDMWLWYSFLRSGRADIFRMAEAMTRHTSEVDTYHLGQFAGLGSRHNVRHWGCGAKEARISQAAFKRFYYYLTTDERIGDIMHEVANSDFKAVEFDPMRLAQPRNAEESKYPGRIRGGPDWLAFIGNWMTEWERTGDTKWRDKIYAGMDSLALMPYGFRSGQNMVFGYDPANGKLFQVSKELGNYNLPTIMGGAEVVFELNEMVDHPAWQKIWLQYCRLGSAPADVLAKDKLSGSEGADGSFVSEGTSNNYGIGRLAGYAYMKTKSLGFAEVAGKQLGNLRNSAIALKKIDGADAFKVLEEAGDVSTNNVAQYSLNAIEVLEMCADHLPAVLPPPTTLPAAGTTSQPPRDIRTPGS